MLCATGSSRGLSLSMGRGPPCAPTARDATTLPLIRKAIERYLVYPGQATAYMIGKLKIMELRERGREELGEDFDIRAFHDVILTNGPVPLSIMEENVDRWIASAKGDS